MKRSSFLSSGDPRSFVKRRKLQLLLEELAKPEVDIPALSQHSAMVMSQIQQQNATIIPHLVRYAHEQSKPLVLEIMNNKFDELARNKITNQSDDKEESASLQGTSRAGKDMDSAKKGLEEAECSEDTRESELESSEKNARGEKQIEVIFSDSVPRGDGEMANHIMAAEVNARTSETTGTVNVPNSFPLFQIVHTGEVPEDVQQEIVRLIRQANPELDLNSITFKFKSPETVEIIANINT